MRGEAMPVPAEYFDDRTITRGSKAFIRLPNGKYLFYRRDGNTDDHPYTIDLIGGRAEEGETGFQALAREAVEEVGAQINRSDVLYAKAYPSNKQPGSVAWLAIVDLVDGQTLELGDEGTELFEMSLEEYLERTDAYPYFQDRLRDYLKTVQ